MRSAPLEDELLAAPFPMEPSVFTPGSFESAAQRRGLLRARPILSSWPAMSPGRARRARRPLTAQLLQQIEPQKSTTLSPVLCSRIDLAFYWFYGFPQPAGRASPCFFVIGASLAFVQAALCNRRTHRVGGHGSAICTEAHADVHDPDTRHQGEPSKLLEQILLETVNSLISIFLPLTHFGCMASYRSSPSHDSTFNFPSMFCACSSHSRSGCESSQRTVEWRVPSSWWSCYTSHSSAWILPCPRSCFPQKAAFSLISTSNSLLVGLGSFGWLI